MYLKKAPFLLALVSVLGVSLAACSGSGGGSTACTVSGATTGQLVFNSSNSGVAEAAGFFVCASGSPSHMKVL